MVKNNRFCVLFAFLFLTCLLVHTEWWRSFGKENRRTKKIWWEGMTWQRFRKKSATKKNITVCSQAKKKCSEFTLSRGDERDKGKCFCGWDESVCEGWGGWKRWIWSKDIILVDFWSDTEALLVQLRHILQKKHRTHHRQNPIIHTLQYITTQAESDWGKTHHC